MSDKNAAGQAVPSIDWLADYSINSDENGTLFVRDQKGEIVFHAGSMAARGGLKFAFIAENCK